MRTLKFRAWDKEKKLMCHVFNIQFDVGYVGIMSDNYCVFKREIEKVELMQYTGRKDTMDNEIWEGDVRRFWDKDLKKVRIGVVQYRAPEFIMYGTGDKTQLEDTVLIGNIYENPELLNNK